MSAVALERLRKVFNKTTALDDVSLAIGTGEFLCVVGRTNAGKSTLLKTIAGLYRADGGRVIIGGRDLTLLPPHKRRVSLLFQNIALFPTMTGYENIAFPLRTTNVAGDAVERRVRSIAQMLKVEHLLDRLPRTFSGGEQQRVAIGRAIIQPGDLLMLDEPLTNLDASIRIRLRIEFKKLHREFAQTIIYVTHDQVEAMSLSDRVAVLDGGRIQQIGSPDEVYHRPVNRFVAEFIGIENIVAGRRAGGSAERPVIAVADKTLLASAEEPLGGGAGEVWVCIKAEDVELALPGDERSLRRPDVSRLAADITATHHLGVLTKLELDCGFRLYAYVMTRQVGAMQLVPGRRVEVVIAAEAIHLLPRPPTGRSAASSRS